MSGFPFNHLAQQFSLYRGYYTGDGTGQPFVPQDAFQFQPNALPPFPQQPVDPSAAAFADLDDANKPMASTSGATRGRKRPPGEQAKFRRTRSGCYTCRSRRVKVCRLDWLRSPATDARCSVMRPGQHANVCVGRFRTY
jgi:hypothetical protein